MHRSPGRPTRDQAEQRNRELLEKALDLFLENGFERTTIEGITAAVGMAKRTVYARYGDKMTLFKAALQRAIEEWMLPVDRLREAETADLEETLLEIGRLLVTNILTPEGLRLLRITNVESIRFPDTPGHRADAGLPRRLVPPPPRPSTAHAGRGHRRRQRLPPPRRWRSLEHDDVGCAHGPGRDRAHHPLQRPPVPAWIASSLAIHIRPPTGGRRTGTY
jgi:AcrR family transcriptional regulator